MASAFLSFCLLGSEQYQHGQEEKEKAGQENQLCPGLHAGLCGGGGWEKDVNQAQIHLGQQFSPSAADCEVTEQFLQQQTQAPPVLEQVLLQVIYSHLHQTGKFLSLLYLLLGH